MSPEGSQGAETGDRRGRRKLNGVLVLVAVASALLGAAARGFFPPFVLDDPFWRAFLSGPPAAGLFALLGAGVAYLAARVAAQTSRRGNEREEWWARAEWALNLARSDQRKDRVIGLRALEALGQQATETEYKMVLSVTEAVIGDVDTAGTTGHNRKGKRRWRRGAEEDQTA